jgi:hypothetical protein
MIDAPAFLAGPKPDFVAAVILNWPSGKRRAKASNGRQESQENENIVK